MKTIIVITAAILLASSAATACPKGWTAAPAYHHYVSADDKMQRCVKPTKGVGVLLEKYSPIKNHKPKN